MKFTQQANIEFYQNKHQNSVLAEYESLKILMFSTEIRGEKKPSLMVWRGKQKNPFYNYYLLNGSQRNERLSEIKGNEDAKVEYKAKAKAEKKAFVPNMEIGDIYYSSWGYEQTNVSFYQLVEIKGKSTGIFREIGQDVVKDSTESHGMACNVVGVKDEFLENAEPLKKRVGQYGIRINSSESASKWNGQPTYKSWYY